MSDDSPQRGWDNWFDAEQDSSGDEQQAPEQQVPPSAPQESEPESEAEQTSWTMPAIGSGPEGEQSRDAAGAREQEQPAQDQRVQPKRHARREAPAAEAAPTQQMGAVAENQPTQQVQARTPDSASGSGSGSASGSDSDLNSDSDSDSDSQGAWQPEPARDSESADAPTAASSWSAARPSAKDPEPAANPWNAAEPGERDSDSALAATAWANARPPAKNPEPAANPWSAAEPDAKDPKPAANPWAAAEPGAKDPEPAANPWNGAQAGEQDSDSALAATAWANARPPAKNPEPAANPWSAAEPDAKDPEPAANPWSAAQPSAKDSEPADAAAPWTAAQPTTQLPAQDAAPAPAPKQQPLSEQQTQVWAPAPGPTQQNAPAQQSQPRQSQPPQNPYATAAMQQQSAQPQQPAGYGAPPQAPTVGGYPQQSGGDGQPEHRRSAASSSGAANRSQPRSRKKLFISSGVGAAAVVALAMILVMNNGSLTGSSHPLAAQTPTGFQPTGTSVAGDAEQTADAFLSAWENGDFKQAAAYTDDPTQAQSMLTSYETGLNLNGLQLTATGSTVVTAAPSAGASGSSDSSPSGTTASSSSSAAAVPSTTAGVVTFNVVAKVGLPAASTTSTSSASASASTSASASAASSASSSSTSSSSATASSVTANWSYASKLTAYKKNGGWWVQWVPSLVAPNLTASEKLVSSAIAPSAAEVEDSTGADLSSATDPGVHNIYLALKKHAPTGEGTPGVQIELETASGTPITSSADVLSQPVNTAVVKTSINPTAEAAAQQAVLKYADSSMVVIQPSTGDILAVANNDGDNDFALTAEIAPGSTNKIITSTALLTGGLVSSPSQAVECPKQITVNGTVFNNSTGESEPANTPFLDDFAISCNNAFGSWYTTIGSTTLATTAQKYYGLNEPWDIGTGASSTYYEIPSSASNGELAQELFGQGQLEASPLAMASVAATVDTGDFKQPIVVPGQAQASATPLPSNVQQDLQQLMKAVVNQSDGTAYNLFSGVNSTVYGKTGTADVGASQQKPNSWMVAFDPTLNVAIACVVLDAGYGASYAAPEEAQALEALQ